MVVTDTQVKTLVIAGTFVTDPMALLAYRPLARAVSGEIITLSRAGLDQTEASVKKVIRYLERHGEPTVLIGHSQGGLVAVLVAGIRPDLVSGAITLGAPLHGTHLAAGWMPPGVAAMAPGSWWTDVARASSSYVEPRFVNIVGEKDMVILPQFSGLMSGAEHHWFPVGHLGLILDAEVIRFVRHLVRETDFQSPNNLAAVP